MVEFNGRDYTETSVLEELLLIERHARDGSAYNAGCSCIEEKHLLTLAGLASEMPTLSKDEKEKDYYAKLADWARERRLEIIAGNWKQPSHSHGLSKCEKQHPEVQHALSECLKEGHTLKECRKSVPCP